MLFASFIALPLVVASALAAVVPRQEQKGTIVTPASGTAIGPGSEFAFQYIPRADYGVSTFWYHVFLLDEAATVSPLTLAPVDVFSAGHYFGRYDYPNYPVVPYPTNPAPSQLTMPDFSVSPGGFASGMFASDRKMKLVVVEEYGDGSPVGLGNKLSLALSEVVYNATSPA